MSVRPAIAASAAAAMVALPGLALATSGKQESARLQVQSTKPLTSVTIHNGASATLGHASVKLTLTLGSQQAALALTSADGRTLYTLTLGTFLKNGGTWILSGPVVGSSASAVAIAVYPEGPGAGKSKAKNTSADYAQIVAFTEKTDLTAKTLTPSSKPLAVGHTTFAITRFFGHTSAQIVVRGPQFPRALFVLGHTGPEVIVSPKHKQAFIVTASQYRG
jgi:hypothetical protein